MFLGGSLTTLPGKRFLARRKGDTIDLMDDHGSPSSSCVACRRLVIGVDVV